jgi:Protein of unknown function (DUF2855)
VDFLVKRGDLSEISFQDADAPAVGDGEALLAVRSFGLTANNITYGVLGDAVRYWEFFPAPEGWGRIPVWGFADVVETASELPEGIRVYGYLPPSSHAVLRPEGVGERGFVDATPHRAELPAVYNRYARTDGDALYDPEFEDEMILFRPLFLTSFVLDEFLAGKDFFGADSVIFSSASSKTALAAAFLMSRREGIDLIGLTSAKRREFVESTGVYGQVLGYDDLDSLPGGRAIYADFSGDAAVRAAVHRHFGDRLGHSAMIGATHVDRLAGGDEKLPGPEPKMFFAPEHIRAPGGDGEGGSLAGVPEAWHPFVRWTRGWLEVVHGSGPEAVERAYRELLDGRVESATGHVLSLDSAATI